MKMFLCVCNSITESLNSFKYVVYSSYQNRFQEMATKHLVGCVVLTRYSIRTYRIDDIAWDKNPQSTFIDHTGQTSPSLTTINKHMARLFKTQSSPY